jgi:hypothetical protein
MPDEAVTMPEGLFGQVSRRIVQSEWRECEL